jgi:hypothetical protein
LRLCYITYRISKNVLIWINNKKIWNGSYFYDFYNFPSTWL